MLRWTFVATLPLFLLLLGCEKKVEPPKTAEVKGKVTLDGMPMASGKIVFDGGAGVPATELDVTLGVFSGHVQVGTKIVRISSYQTAAPQKGPPKGPGYDTKKEDIVATKFNSASKQTCEVKEGGPNEFTFAVTSK